jgi:uncharacterized protein
MPYKKIIKIFLPIILLAIIFIMLIVIGQNYECPNCHSAEKIETTQVCLKDNCFQMELATDDYERAHGLMFRDHLDQDKGMLFIFDKEGVYQFWMKNTRIPLDIIWLNKEKKVVFINEKAKPCQQIICPIINPKVAAQYVIEINAGLVENMGFKIGDEISIQE